MEADTDDNAAGNDIGVHVFVHLQPDTWLRVREPAPPGEPQHLWELQPWHAAVGLQKKLHNFVERREAGWQRYHELLWPGVPSPSVSVSGRAGVAKRIQRGSQSVALEAYSVPTSLFFAIQCWAVGEHGRQMSERTVAAAFFCKLLDKILRAEGRPPLVVKLPRASEVVEVPIDSSGMFDLTAVLRPCAEMNRLAELWEEHRQNDNSLRPWFASPFGVCRASEAVTFILLHGRFSKLAQAVALTLCQQLAVAADASMEFLCTALADVPESVLQASWTHWTSSFKQKVVAMSSSGKARK